MKKHFRIRSLCVALILSLGLMMASACGGGASAPSGTPNTPAAPAAPSAPSSPDNSGSQSGGDTGFAETPLVTLKWADHNTEGCMTAQSMDIMAEAAFEATKGRVKIDMYHSGVLGTFGDSLSMVENGICDIVWTSVSPFPKLFQYSEIFQLPMLGFTSAQNVTHAFWDLYEAYPEAFEKEFADYKVWMVHSSPPAVIGASKEIKSLADLKGLNLRAAAGPISTICGLWSANPVSMAPPDMYQGMEKGVIHGYIFDGAGINTWGLAEVTTSTIDMGLSFSIDFIFMNKDVWNALPAEDQAALDEIGGRVGSQNGATYMQTEADELFEGYLTAGKDYRVLSPGDALYEELKAPLSAMTEDWIAENTTAAVDAGAMVDFVLERAAHYEG